MKRYRPITELQRLLVFLLFCLLSSLCTAAVPIVASNGISAANLGIVVNTNDPLSREIGEYYRRGRGIPAKNVIRISLPAQLNTLSVEQFRSFNTTLKQRTPVNVQAYVLTWLRPYRVVCMSITTAVAFNYSPDFCSSGCKLTRLSPYFDSGSTQPMLELGIRPAMLLAARDLPSARALIDRGILADGSAPRGTAYFLDTGDISRSVRNSRFALIDPVLGDAIKVQRLTGDALRHARDVMFYFTGAVHVPDLTSNRFLPGAVADHLTSTGDALLDTDQMSSLRWLEAGATASYGTVIEPCNFPGKFSDPLIMMKHYLSGETLIEAYWKSVQMPGQGLFIGEPLAAPWGKGNTNK